MIAKIKVEPSYRPAWFLEDQPAHIPLPTKRFHELPGEVIAWGIWEGKSVPLLSVESGKLFSQYDWSEWKNYILGEKYRDIIRPFYTRLPTHYHIVPGALRNLAGRLLLSSQGVRTIPRHDFPGFPIEQGLELLRYVYEQSGAVHGVGSSSSSQIILTHDIDTKDGFKWVKRTATLEMEYGFRSLWNVVGCSKIDYEVLDWLMENGFEIGLHGYNHDNRLIFLAEEEIRNRLDRCVELLNRYHMRSFRSPSWFRNEKLFKVLKDYFEFDYSYLDTDIICPGGNGGCLWTCLLYTSPSPRD